MAGILDFLATALPRSVFANFQNAALQRGMQDSAQQGIWGTPSQVQVTPQVGTLPGEQGPVAGAQNRGIREPMYAASLPQGGVLDAVPQQQRPFIEGLAKAMGPAEAAKYAADANVQKPMTAYEGANLKQQDQHFQDTRLDNADQRLATAQSESTRQDLERTKTAHNIYTDTPQYQGEVAGAKAAAIEPFQTQSDESWGQPVEEMGPNGKPIVVRYGSRGGRQIVQGAVPKQQQPTRQMQPKAINDLSAVGDQAAAMDRLSQGYKPEYGGHTILGELSNTFGRTFGDSTGQTQWWQDYQVQLNQMRNKLFGAALTAQEKAEFEKAVISPRMDPEQIRRNLARQDELANIAAKKLAKAYTAAGYNKEAVEGAIGMSLDDLSGAKKPGPGDYENPPGGTTAAGPPPPPAPLKGMTPDLDYSPSLKQYRNRKTGVTYDTTGQVVK